LCSISKASEQKIRIKYSLVITGETFSSMILFEDSKFNKNLFYLAGGCLNNLAMRQRINMSNRMKMSRMNMGERWKEEVDFLGAKHNIMVGIYYMYTYPVHRRCSLAGQSSYILASSCR
jgi:hypothetical protein